MEHNEQQNNTTDNKFDNLLNLKNTEINLPKLMTELVEKYGYDVIEEALNKKNEFDKTEPLLDEKNRQFIAPVNPTYPKIWNYFWKKQVESFWHVGDIDFGNDYNDFMTLTKEEQHFIEMILAFFAAFDGIVNFNLSERFTKEITNQEALFAYQFQMAMENIHSQTYAEMLNVLVKNPAKREHLFNSIKTVPSVKLIADWTFKWISSSKSFAHRLAAFAIVEGVLFSGAFAAIFWIKRYKNKDTDKKSFMSGFIKSNDYIARDEGLHTRFACELYSHLVNKLSQEEIENMIKEAVLISQKFMDDALPIRLLGMNKDIMNKYIQYVADFLLSLLGYKKIYNINKCPLKYMETIGFLNKVNFFEERPSEYGGVGTRSFKKLGKF